jgi:hypothetical protein
VVGTVADALDLDAITARADAATEGPWNLYRDGILCGVADSTDGFICEPPMRWTDAAFVAHAREDLPALVAEVRRLREALAEVAKHQEDMADSLDDHITHEDIHVALIEGMRLAADSRELRS